MAKNEGAPRRAIYSIAVTDAGLLDALSVNIGAVQVENFVAVGAPRLSARHDIREEDHVRRVEDLHRALILRAHDGAILQ